MSIIDTGVIEIDPVVAFGWVEGGEAVLVDVREEDEWAEERILGLLLVPMSDFEADLFPRRPGKRLVVLCRIGRRSDAIARKLVQYGDTHVYNVAGGLNAWKAAGLPVTGDGLEPAIHDLALLGAGALPMTLGL